MRWSARRSTGRALRTLPHRIGAGVIQRAGIHLFVLPPVNMRKPVTPRAIQFLRDVDGVGRQHIDRADGRATLGEPRHRVGDQELSNP